MFIRRRTALLSPNSATPKQTTLKVADRVVDKVALTENIGRHMHVGRQRGLHRLEGAVYFLGQLYRACRRLLGQSHNHRRLGLYRGYTDTRQTA